MEQKSGQYIPLPNSGESRKEQIAGMFDRVAHRYDFLNHFFSMGIDKIWRKKAIATIQPIQPKHILDVATGTGDFAIAAANALQPKSVVGVDISNGMLEKGKEKIIQKKLENTISLQYGDSENLPFTEGQFDALTCAYGVRNFENLERGLSEMNRVIRNGGRLAILEFSHPKNFPVKQLYNLYFRYIVPKVGAAVSKDNAAYKYLPESVKVFPEGKVFCEILTRCGFKNVQAKPLTFGITTLYTAEK